MLYSQQRALRRQRSEWVTGLRSHIGSLLSAGGVPDDRDRVTPSGEKLHTAPLSTLWSI